MARVNYATREINYKIVYYGTGLGGKTTNLRYIHGQLSPTTRGELVQMATETERTLFFDFMALDLGQVNDFKTRLSLYTVPGQEEYNRSRKLILQDVDGIIFVADSNPIRAQANVESLQNMIDNLSEYRYSLDKIPWVLQYNKRDLADAMPFERMEQDLNFANVPSFEAVALEGLKVFATLRSLGKMVISSMAKGR
jgi:signal recognition particle receptor subunit beta